MEMGLIFALLTSVAFSIANVLIRKGTFQTREAFTASLLSVFVGLPLFLFTVLLASDWNKLFSLSWQGFALLGTAGIIHFVLGRLLSYKCIRLIGANRGGAIGRTQIFYAVISGILILSEPLTPLLISGVLCIAVGTTLVSVEKGDGEGTRMHGKGVLVGLVGAFFWGISGILIKLGVTELGSSSAAGFISFTAAFLVVAGLLFGKHQREQLSRLRRESWIPVIISGLFSSVAQFLRFTALSYSPVSVVEPITGTQVLIIFFLSFLINRNIDVFTWKILVGIVATVVGTFLLFQ